MKVTPIDKPVAGEKLVELRPPLALYPQTAWKRRLHHYSGRALTHTALNREQNWLNGQVSALGRVVSAGILDGLKINARTLIEDETPFTQLHVSAGRGLSYGGDIVTLNRDITCALRNVFVFRHDEHPEIMGDGQLAATQYAEQLPTLGELIDRGTVLPRAGILVLQPLFAEVREQEGDDPCGLDPSDLAFEKWQLLDACRLVLYTWPDNWMALPTMDLAWRNRLAATIFSKERSLAENEIHPWEKLGVAVGLIGFNEQYQASFVDRDAVVRSGGRIDINGNGLLDEGNPLLWQAQLEQFNSQLAQLAVMHSTADDLLTATQQQFRYLPPVGVLPKPFAKPRSNEQTFFPSNYVVRARAIPLEQLDVAIRESEPLLPFDLNAFDDVELLVPVQQNFYDANLLRIESVDASLNLAVQEYTQARNDWLGRRYNVRQKASRLYQAMYGKPWDFGSDDDAIDNLEIPSPQQAALIEQGTSWRILMANNPPGNWNIFDFNDIAFSSSLSGWGYGKGLFETDISELRGRYNFLFVRKQFTLQQQDLSNSLQLQIQSNASFVVYLNGVVIYTHSVSPIGFGLNVRKRNTQINFSFDDNAQAQLQAGNNLLAIAIQPTGTARDYFYFTPRLVQTMSAQAYQALAIDEEAYGVSLPSEAEGGTAIAPLYTVDEIENLKTDITQANPQLVSGEELNSLDSDGLEDFILLLDRKIATTNDLIDFNFARMRTEIYRIDQYIFGNDQGTKLATSPILATIAKSNSSAEQLKALNEFFEDLKNAGTQGDDVIVAGESLAGDTVTGAGSTGSSSGGSTFDGANTGIDSSLITREISPTFLSADLSGSITRNVLIGSVSDISRVSTGAITTAVKADSTLVSGATLSTVSKEETVFKASLSSTDSALKSIATRSVDDSSKFFAKSATVEDVQEQNAIVGATEQYRNVTVGERLEESVALNSITSGVATKATTITGLRQNSGIVLSGITIPGVSDPQNPEQPLDFANVSDATITDILNLTYDLDPNVQRDESFYFKSSIGALENTSVLLRKVEGRVYRYKKLRTQCLKIFQVLKTQFSHCDKRLAEITVPLAEARHDLSVARALLEEDERRVAAINQQRDTILNKRVPYYVFRRPRFAFSHLDAPVRILFEKDEPGLPFCDISDEQTPSEISGLIKLIKQAPLKWLKSSDKLLDKFNRPQNLYQMADFSFTWLASSSDTLDKLLQKNTSSNKTTVLMMAALEANIGMLKSHGNRFTKAEVNAIQQSDWKNARSKFKEYGRYGDIVDAPHGKTAGSQLAAAELENMRRVLACIYHQFSAVLPAIRVKWIDKFSEFDESVPMSNLYNLPYWDQVDYEHRRDTQELVTWLYKQFNTNYAEAKTFIDNLVRICILLASEAPVGKIIAGIVEQQSSASKGETVNVRVPPEKVSIGDEISIQHGGKEVVKGRVENIGKQGASVRVEEVKGGAREIPSGAKAQIKQAGRAAPQKQEARKKTPVVVKQNPSKSRSRMKARGLFK